MAPYVDPASSSVQPNKLREESAPLFESTHVPDVSRLLDDCVGHAETSRPAAACSSSVSDSSPSASSWSKSNVAHVTSRDAHVTAWSDANNVDIVVGASVGPVQPAEYVAETRPDRYSRPAVLDLSQHVPP